jgi:hypothetical protein
VNPTNIPQTWRWPEVIARESRYDPNLVWQHLQARMSKR